jgi:hypothetical protein
LTHLVSLTLPIIIIVIIAFICNTLSPSSERPPYNLCMYGKKQAWAMVEALSATVQVLHAQSPNCRLNLAFIFPFFSYIQSGTCRRV